VQPERLAAGTLQAVVEQITQSVRQRDLRLLLESICEVNHKRTIAVITTSRADYSHLVMGSHLSPEFGLSAKEIQKDGFAIAASVETLLSSDTDVGMAKSIGIAVLSVADLLGRIRPDILLLIADRYEILAPASVALSPAHTDCAH
jgi:UDP-N-acetylglucosamine 2-epimerase